MNAPTVNLSKTGVFRHLPEPDLANMVATAMQVKISEGETAIKQGDVGDMMYILLSGKARAYIGNKEVKAYDTTGEYFGERVTHLKLEGQLFVIFDKALNE